MNKQFAPFAVGQEVECINDDYKFYPLLSNGRKYTVTGVYKSCCNWQVTVGIDSPTRGFRCITCGQVTSMIGEHRFVSSRFRAITPAFKEITFAEMKEPVSAN